ncbi:MAG: signal peptide peptidase SppA [Desulfobacteraceae bacterium]|nr:MAG: signal peptide peptidase SppA [Desulfobacteraceae bacterium]
MNKRFRVGSIVLIMTILAIAGCSVPRITLFGDRDAPLKEYTLQGSGRGKVLVLSIDGTISEKPEEKFLRGKEPSTVQQVAAYLKHAEQDPEIKTLLLKINSPGGTVTASDILYHEISAYKKRTGVKIVAVMMNVAASGGYYIALPADHIMAHPTTVTGSVGVIFLRPMVTGLMEKVGLSVAVNRSGEQKDMGSPFRSPTDEEVAIFQGLIDGLAKRFLDLVMQHRRLQPDQLARVTSARIFLAPQAQELGLVDQIGYLDDAIVKAKAIAGLPADARVIAFRRQEKEDDTIYNPAIQYSGGNAILPGLAQLQAVAEADFYYIWPAALGQ